MHIQPKTKNKPTYTWVKPNDAARKEKISYPAHIASKKSEKLELIAAGKRFGFYGAITSTRNVLHLFNRKGHMIAKLEGVTMETAKRRFRKYYNEHAVV